MSAIANPSIASSKIAAAMVGQRPFWRPRITMPFKSDQMTTASATAPAILTSSLMPAFYPAGLEDGRIAAVSLAKLTQYRRGGAPPRTSSGFTRGKVQEIEPQNEHQEQRDQHHSLEPVRFPIASQLGDDEYGQRIIWRRARAAVWRNRVFIGPPLPVGTAMSITPPSLNQAGSTAVWPNVRKSQRQVRGCLLQSRRTPADNGRLSIVP